MANHLSHNSGYPAGSLFYRRHPYELLVPGLIAVGMCLGLGLILFIISGLIPVNQIGYVILFAGLVAFFVISYLMTQWLFWYMDIWIITDDKLIDFQLKSFFLHHLTELPLRQVQDISYNTSGILATLFKCGDITVQTASKEGAFKLMSIYQPQRAVKDIEMRVTEATNELFGAHEFIYSPAPVKLGDILVSRQLITRENLVTALAEQQTSKERLGKILLRHNLITKEDLLSALSAQYRIPQIDLSFAEIDQHTANCLTADIVYKYRIMPVAKTPNGVLEIAVDVMSDDLVREVRDACGSPVFFVLADEDIISTLIQKYYPNNPVVQ